jgi:hypothetical protein
MDMKLECCVADHARRTRWIVAPQDYHVRCHSDGRTIARRTISDRKPVSLALRSNLWHSSGTLPFAHKFLTSFSRNPNRRPSRCKIHGLGFIARQSPVFLAQQSSFHQLYAGNQHQLHLQKPRAPIRNIIGFKSSDLDSIFTGGRNTWFWGQARVLNEGFADSQNHFCSCQRSGATMSTENASIHRRGSSFSVYFETCDWSVLRWSYYNQRLCFSNRQ